MICSDPNNGESHKQGQPLAVLSEYRRFKGRVMFGKHVSVLIDENQKSNLISKNDVFEIN